MIITELPQATNLNNNLSESGGNVIVYARSNGEYFYPRHKTPYVFVTNFINQGNYLLNSRPIEVSQKNFYFLNANDELEIQFKKQLPLQTLGIFFDQKFIRAALQCITFSDEQLLEFYENRSEQEFYIPSVPFELTQNIQDKIASLLRSPMKKEEQDHLLFELITQFVMINNDTLKQLKKIDVVKKSTKEELYKRLFLSKEFIHDNASEKLTIDRIAQEACMNKFHYLSNFKKLFNITPHQYLNEVRLKKAYRLLVSRQCNVTEACFSVGFESIGSFSNLFKKKFRVSPSILLNLN